jgi:hypothetical protein
MTFFLFCSIVFINIGLWWIILLRAYGKITGDYSLQERVDVQTGLKMILKLCLTDGFDMFPSLLVTDGSCMIDRRMGIHGHPLEIQVSLTTLCFLILLCFALIALCIWKLSPNNCISCLTNINFYVTCSIYKNITLK